MDFAEIKSAVQPLYDRLDHYLLNEIEGLENPTSENLGRWIWDRLKATVPQLSKLLVSVTCKTGCVFCEETEPMDRNENTA